MSATTRVHGNPPGGRAGLGLLAGVAAVGLGLAGLAVWAWNRPGDAVDSPYRRGDYAGAADEARAALREQPDDLDALRLLARASMRLGQSEVGRGIYARIGPDAMRAEDRFLLARDLIRIGRTEAATELLESALEAEPDHAEALAELARLHVASDHLSEATALVERLAEVPGQEVRGLVLLGALRSQRHDPAGAVEALDAALAADPDLDGFAGGRAEVLRTIARAALAAGLPARARAAAESLREADPAAGSEADRLLGRALLQEGKIAEAAATSRADAIESEPDPIAHESALYVGARTCRPCHPEIAKAHAGSHHASSYIAAADFGDLPGLDTPIPDPEAPDVTLSYRPAPGGRYALRAESGTEAAEVLVAFAFGSGDRGATPVGLDSKGDFRELRLSHYGESGWDLTTGHPDLPDGDAPDDFLGPVLTDDAVRRCLECHVTDPHAALAGLDLDPSDSAAAEYPTAREAIGCERCHGPGGNHVLAMAAAPAFPEVAIGRPRLAAPAAVTALCARCHSPRGMEISRDEPASIRFQGTTLTWSRCYTDSDDALSCVSCHDPHRDAEPSHGYYATKCLACHDPSVSEPPPLPEGDGARPIDPDPRMPRVPCPVEPEGDCISCHMPTRTGVIPHTAFTDHYIRARPETD